MSEAIVTALPGALPPGMLWQPTIGPEVELLMERTRLPAEATDQIAQKAALILGKGQPPLAGQGNRTGLVVGYVQSGKTLSFTTVIALARDNGFPVVIVVAGTKNLLLNQTTDRLIGDLQVNADIGPPRWTHIKNPAVGDVQYVEGILRDWRDQNVPANEKPTLLITVAKQHTRLNNLNDVLRRLDFRDIPALIIDDEADQASLNTRINQNQESTTYQRLLALKANIPNHTLLQYTATPQAPLLINIIDVLSPEFVEVLEPGDGYVGGMSFFGNNQAYVRVIPAEEIPTPDVDLPNAPPTLIEALQVFFVGVAAGLIEGWTAKNPTRSMFVHPSRTTDRHFEYKQFIEAIKVDWARILSPASNDPDRADLVEDFTSAYQDVAGTVENLPPLADILARLPRAIAQTQIEEVNTRGRATAPEIQWRRAYSWILVGGQALDRGFTIKGLTVTYMPRDIGGGNADTLQQRARFFGYKEQYLGYCRIYLEGSVLSAFDAYVEHEEQMRAELEGISGGAGLLKGWKRRFILSDELNACRHNVIQYDYVRGNFSDDWFFPKMVKMEEQIIADNRAAVREFAVGLEFAPDTTYVSDLPAQQHQVCDSVPLERLVADLLVKFRVADGHDTQSALGVMLQLSKALKNNPQETGRVYLMRPSYHEGSRGIDGKGRIGSIVRLLQGRTETARGEVTYPGDHEFRDPNRVTVQIHHFDLREGQQLVRTNVPVIAVWVPQRMELDWIAQHQPT